MNVIDNVVPDLRYGVRTLARNPVFTFAAVLALALGIGANTVVFSVVNGVLPRPPPYGDPDRLVMVFNSRPLVAAGSSGACRADFLDWKERSRSFQTLDAFEINRFTNSRFTLTGDGEPEQAIGWSDYWATARLKPGITLQPAQAELNVIESAIDKQIPGNFDLHGTMIPLMQRLAGKAREGLLLVMAAVGAVLLVLVVNLANLSLARAAGRARDAAIRTALGASQGRLVRQSLVESVLLAALGGGLGIVLAWWGVNALVAAAPVDLPRLNEVRMDWRVLLFAPGVSLVAGVAFGVLPAIRSALSAPIDALKSGGRCNTEGRGGLRVRNLLVSLEVGLSAALLVIAGLLIASFTRVMKVDRGFKWNACWR